MPTLEQRQQSAATGMSVALWASVLGDEPAVTSPSGDRTFAELNANANRLVRALRSRGVGPGDSVAIVCRNRPEMVEAVQACVRGGYRWTPVNWHLRPAEAAHIVNDSSAAALIGDATLGDLLPETAALAESLRVPVVMTSRYHRSGTDRVLEAAKNINVEPDAVIVNIQGDEPALEPAMLTELLMPFRAPDVQVTTLIRAADTDESGNPDRVKVTVARDGSALYFSRASIPYRRADREATLYIHIGIYAFRIRILEKFDGLDQSPLETIEKLEQLRLLENNIPIHTVVTEHKSIGVDRPEDIPVVTQIISDKKI
jgi:3-deoxy-manno-octulosonate cytidylyltransferase (CMP-KDO synthetase)